MKLDLGSRWRHLSMLLAFGSAIATPGGVAIGQGQPLAEVLSRMHMVAEGVKTAGPLMRVARQLGVEMPIVEQVAAIVEGTTGPREALVSLMGRAAKAEWDEDRLSAR